MLFEFRMIGSLASLVSDPRKTIFMACPTYVRLKIIPSGNGYSKVDARRDVED